MTEGLGWEFWTTAILGLIGALAWLPQISEWTKRAKIEGKIISQYHNYGCFLGDTNSGSIVVQKLSIFSKNKEFFNKNMKVFLKFPNIRDEIEVKIIAPRLLSFVFNENNKNSSRELSINPNEYILHYTVFPKDESVIGYIVFKAAFEMKENYEYIRYEFRGFGEKKLELKISSNEIKANELLT